MKRFEIIQLIMFVLIFLSGFSPILYWVFNPELSMMQVGLKFWFVPIIILIFGWYALKVEDKNQSTF